MWWFDGEATDIFILNKALYHIAEIKMKSEEKKVLDI